MLNESGVNDCLCLVNFLYASKVQMTDITTHVLWSKKSFAKIGHPVNRSSQMITNRSSKIIFTLKSGVYSLDLKFRLVIIGKRTFFRLIWPFLTWRIFIWTLWHLLDFHLGVVNKWRHWFWPLSDVIWCTFVTKSFITPSTMNTFSTTVFFWINVIS